MLAEHRRVLPPRLIRLPIVRGLFRRGDEATLRIGHQHFGENGIHRLEQVELRAQRIVEDAAEQRIIPTERRPALLDRSQRLLQIRVRDRRKFRRFAHHERMHIGERHPVIERLDRLAHREPQALGETLRAALKKRALRPAKRAVADQLPRDQRDDERQDGREYKDADELGANAKFHKRWSIQAGLGGNIRRTVSP